MPAVIVSTIIAFAPGITPGEFEQLHKQLQPPHDELWSSIPWELSIHQARLRAAEEKKPLFMWVMNGNPCGTT